MDNLKKIIQLLSLIAATMTSIIIICTLLTTYQFIYISQAFNSYYMIKLGVGITMILWAIRFLFHENGKAKYTYSIICAIIACLAFFFMHTYVK
ncbi:hypothetical protein SAMN02745163_02369 [Clostridium cavendishii DSM 21758]|uniref:Uncharacterized protein n=1 Tax=Clostridium cavendishii DSM 21758 TaxID=1121302 RepID=A0A1M6LFK1_9CLOT|nr:hypothetical protein [Clostridium cavendishii]SHJ70011.1 hypothetical protein SAMN02745163_02369 [Clostridium cavendishii DSM 21758]